MNLEKLLIKLSIYIMVCVVVYLIVFFGLVQFDYFRYPEGESFADPVELFSLGVAIVLSIPITIKLLKK